MKRPAVLLVVALLATLGFLTTQKTFLASLSAKPTPTPSPIQVVAGADEARLTTLKFYQEYDSCVKQSLETVSEDVSLYCQEQNSYVASSLTENVREKESVEEKDPIICSDNFPSSYQVSEVTPNGENLQVHVSASFGTSAQALIAVLTKEESKWLVSNIICS